MKKNSAEAKAWGAKMKRSRNNKTKIKDIPSLLRFVKSETKKSKRRK
jgi:hypothetical protein